MPRTNVTPIQLAAATGVSTSASTTIDATLVTNGVRVVGGGGVKKGTLVVKVTNSAGGAKNLTVKGGTVPGADRKDLVIAVPASGERMVALTETAKYKLTDESYSIDLETGFTGTLQVLRVPR